MWDGFDPAIRKDWASIRQMMALRQQTPTKEWPLVCVEMGNRDALLVVREWPDGSVTAYTAERTE